MRFEEGDLVYDVKNYKLDFSLITLIWHNSAPCCEIISESQESVVAMLTDILIISTRLQMFYIFLIHRNQIL